MAPLSFADLCEPIAPPDFFARHWTKEGVHLRKAGRTFDAYLSWSAVAAILNAGDIAFPKIKLSRSDRPVPTDQFTVKAGGQAIVDGRAVLRYFDEGASFGITGADSHCRPLREVVDCLYDTLLESVHTNVYCSPANTQGFQCHYDLHEVFVLQVDGEKHWRVYRPESDAPVTSWNAADSPHETSEPYLDVVLRPGDVLYVPRGHWHYAVARDSASLHVTVGVTCRKGDAFLDWLGNELFQDPAWRRNVPLLSNATPGGQFTLPDGFERWARDLKASLTSKLSEPDLLERFCKDTLGSIQPVHNASLIDGVPVEQLRFARPAGRRHYFVTGDPAGANAASAQDDGAEAITVSIAGSEIELEAAASGLLQRILDAESFTAADVRASHPDANPKDTSDLLIELTRAGLLVATRL